MLGDAPTHIIDKLNAKTKPWYLRPNYEDSEIQIDPDGKVRAGTVAGFVERLTAHEHSGASYGIAFSWQLKLITTSRHVIYQNVLADLQVFYGCGNTF